jgi:hypothetical protein
VSLSGGNQPGVIPVDDLRERIGLFGVFENAKLDVHELALT